MSATALEAFTTLDIRVGTVRQVQPNTKARKPAYVVDVDFGPELGVKRASAQLCEHYRPDGLIGRQVTAVVNFPPKLVAGVRSEILILAAVSTEAGTRLLVPDVEVPDGARIA